MTERGLVAPAAGGSVLAQFDDILAAAAPELAGHVQAVGFDADTGRLDVAPDAPAYGTKLRWTTPQLIAAVNEKVPSAHIRSVHIRPPASSATQPPQRRRTTCSRRSCSGSHTVPRCRCSGGASNC
ncbi:DciA family protein [Streptomyces sp. NPDC003027]